MAKKSPSKKTQNLCSKMSQTAVKTQNLPQIGSPNQIPSSPMRCPRKISQLRIAQFGVVQLRYQDSKVRYKAESWVIIGAAPDSALPTFFKVSDGCSEFVRNLIKIKQICYPTKVDIPDSKAQSKFSSEVISIKCGSHFHCHFKSKTTKGLGKISKTSKPERRVKLDQTRYFGANRADEILIRARLLRMLTKVKLSL